MRRKGGNISACCGHTGEHLVALFACDIASHAHPRGVKPKVRPTGITFAYPTSVRSVHSTPMTCSCRHPPRQYRHFTHEQRCYQVDSPMSVRAFHPLGQYNTPRHPLRLGESMGLHTRVEAPVSSGLTPPRQYGHFTQHDPTISTRNGGVNGAPPRLARTQASSGSAR